MKRLFMIALLSLPIAVWADATDAEMAVAVKRLEENGLLVAISPEDDVVKWLREAIAAGQKRLAAELPATLGQAKLDIELVSVPHPEIESRVNKLFVQWKREPNPASFIPLVGRAVDNKMNVFVALETRVAMEGQLLFTVQSQPSFQQGVEGCRPAGGIPLDMFPRLSGATG